MIGDPRTALPRTDLPFLRHRARRRPAADNAAVSDFLSGRGPHPDRHASMPPPVPPRPAAPAPPPAAAAPRAPSSSPLDLSSPVAPSAPPPPPVPAPPAATTSLDLDGARTTPAPMSPAASPSAPSPALRPPGGPLATRNEPGPGIRVPAPVRVAAGAQRVLNVKTPTVTLTRVQSGIGALTFEAVCSAAVGDLRIGCAYQLGSGPTSTVQLAGGNRFAPPDTRRPVILAQRDQYEQIGVDLRQVDDLRRAIVYAFSDGGSELTWAGTLVVSTFGGARIELPMDTLYPGRVAVLMSVVNVGGELWLRAEMETIAGSIRDACKAYGFSGITWRDDRTPAD